MSGTDDRAMWMLLEQCKEQLQACQARFRSVINHNVDGILIVNREGIVQFANPAAEKMVGYADGGLVGKDFGFPVMSGDTIEIELAQDICARPYMLDEPLPRSAPLIVEMRVSETEWDGRICYLVSLRDITRRKQAEEALRKSGNEFKMLFNSTGDALFIHDLHGRFLQVNQVACERLGYSREELLQMTPAEIDAPAYGALIQERMVLLRQHGHALFEAAHVRRDGTVIPIEISARLIEYQGELAVLSIARDISERKRSDEQIRHLNAVLRAIRNVNQLITKEQNRNDLLQGACNCLVETRGYLTAWIALMDGPDQPASYIAHSGLGERVALLAKVLAHESQDTGDELRPMPLKCVQWAFSRHDVLFVSEPWATCGNCPLIQIYQGRDALDESKSAPLNESKRSSLSVRLEHEGRIYGLMTVSVPNRILIDETERDLLAEMAQDLAFALYSIDLEQERCRTERALADSEARYRRLIETMQEGVWMIDRDAHTSFVNPRMAEMLGYTPAEMLGRHLFSFMDEAHVKLCQYHLERRTQGLPDQHDFDFRRRDGTTIHTLLETVPVIDESGAYDGALASVMDITSRRQMESQLRAALQEKEAMLSEIHHRVKNNLQIISSLLDFQAQYIQDAEALSALRSSQRRVYSMSLIHDQLYHTQDLTQIDLAAYAKALTTDLCAVYQEAGSDIYILVDIQDVLLDVKKAIPCGLLINELVSNALKHAFPDRSGPGEIRVIMQKTGDDQYLLAISDNGIGLPPDFEFPSERTLGMFLIETFTKQLRGTVDWSDQGGTTCRITFAP